jgi:hypothetical protein
VTDPAMCGSTIEMGFGNFARESEGGVCFGLCERFWMVGAVDSAACFY